MHYITCNVKIAASVSSAAMCMEQRRWAATNMLSISSNRIAFACIMHWRWINVHEWCHDDATQTYIRGKGAMQGNAQVNYRWRFTHLISQVPSLKGDHPFQCIVHRWYGAFHKSICMNCFYYISCYLLQRLFPNDLDVIKLINDWCKYISPQNIYI